MEGAPYLPYVAGTDPLGDKRANGERDAEREKEKGLIKTRGEGAGGKARTVDLPYGDGIACPDADSRQLADHQRQGKPHVLADMLAPANRSAVHETLPVSYSKTGGAMTSCQNPSDCGIA